MRFRFYLSSRARARRACETSPSREPALSLSKGTLRFQLARTVPSLRTLFLQVSIASREAAQECSGVSPGRTREEVVEPQRGGRYGLAAQVEVSEGRGFSPPR